VIDSHCHLAGDEFEQDLDAVVIRARQAGVSGALVILSAGDDVEAVRAEQVAKAWPDVRFSVGIHPHQAGLHAGVEAAVDLVRRRRDAHAAVAIGEIGLDYHYDFSPRSIQQDVFRAQIRLARDLDLPIVIHTREATDDTFEILRDEARAPGNGALRGVFHCFTGDAIMARQALDLGFHLSFAGILTFPKAVELREVAASVPDDRLLVETDSPYLAPVPHRGKRNEPAYVARVVEALAALRGVPADAIARRTTDNFGALFGVIRTAARA
jgi:TatD DNase family protein